MDQIKIAPGAERVISLLEEAGFAACVVGGCVRDSLLGLAPQDWDLCTSALPEQVKRCCAARGIRTLDTGARHGTVTVDLGAEGMYEVTTFRVDGAYSDHRRPDSVAFVTGLTQDLERRDFTINAMAYSPKAGLTDPFGGRRALAAGVVECVGEPVERFREDALRIMRALRFASVYGFSIGEGTARAVHESALLLEHVAAERLWAELKKLLCGRDAGRILLEYGDVMAVLIPELGACIGFEQNKPCQPYTVYGHMAHAVAACPVEDPAVRLALLLHDIGKPLCYTEDEEGGHFRGHGELSWEIARSAAARLRLDRRTRETVLELVLLHDVKIAPVPEEVRRWLSRLGPERFEQLLAVKQGDALSHSGQSRERRLALCRALEEVLHRVLEEGQCFTLESMKLGGKDLLALGVPPGRRVGELLAALLDEVIRGELANERPALLDRAAALIGGGQREE